jgi:hypothetical protein
MYSGTTLTKASGRIFGAHQKIDRLAARQLKDILPESKRFPQIQDILRFEGHNGPDAVKRKSPAKDEPWHYFQPNDPKDTELVEIIESHFKRLVESLKQQDEVRASFEAAWMAHAIVDGLTPAHHYPYGQKVVELRGGQGLESRTTIKDKLLLPGATVWKFVLNNWKFWGPKGLFMTHAAFELGIATLIKPLRMTREQCIGKDMFVVDADNLAQWYRDLARQVTGLDLYKRFYERGWTNSLAKDIKKQLMPIIVRAVTLSWYGAAIAASKRDR